MQIATGPMIDRKKGGTHATDSAMMTAPVPQSVMPILDAVRPEIRRETSFRVSDPVR